MLRLSAVGQSLYGDEFLTFDDTRDGLGGVFDGLDRNEVTPPLYFVLAWGSTQLGDAVNWVRLPSLVFGTATVPVVYALGRRAVGTRAGLVAASLIAVSPFAIFYSTEARPYALMVFLVALSTLALLRALDGGGLGMWVLYGLSACAALYSHYTAIFVVAVQAGWAFWAHRTQVRTLVIVHLAIAVGYMPWVPSLIEQSQKEGFIAVIGSTGSLSAGRFFSFLVRILPGHPFVELKDLPGRVGLVLLGVALTTPIVAGLVRLTRTGRLPRPTFASPSGLLCILALATPLGLLLYNALGSNLYIPRNLSASLPAIAIVLAHLLTSLGLRLSLAAVALALTALILGTAKSLDAEHQRPAIHDVAQFIEDRAQDGDSVVTPTAGAEVDKSGMYFKRMLPTGTPDDRSAWQPAAHGGSVFYYSALVPSRGLRGPSHLAGPSGRFVLREEKVVPGLFPMAVGRYSGEVDGTLGQEDGRPVVSWSLARGIAISPDAARGAVDGVSASGRQLDVRGWALDAAGRSIPDVVLAFFDKHLLGIGRLNVRPDVAKRYGTAAALVSGFTLSGSLAHRFKLGDLPRLRVFALVGDHGSELLLTPTAKRTAERSLPK